MKLQKILTSVIFFSLLITFLSTCKKDNEDVITPDNSLQIIAEDVIGSNGGEITSSEFVVNIPSGAFSLDCDIKIYKDPASKPFDNYQISSLFIVDGLPEYIGEDITISIKTNSGSTKNDHFVAVGEDSYIPSLDTVMTGFYVEEGAEADGWLTISITKMDTKGSKSPADQETFKLYFTMIAQYTYSKGSHFKISCPSIYTAQAAQLEQMLNTAYDLYKSTKYPMDYSPRTSWPVDVTIRKMKSGKYGEFVPSKRGDNYGCMEFNSTYLDQTDQLAVTAGHEFMHLVQYLYDPRNRYSKAVAKPTWNWVNEATATWVEEKFSNNPNYVSITRKGNEMSPYEGAQLGAQTNPKYHGYGMSSMVKKIDMLYLSDGWPPINNLYKNIKAGDKPIQAFEKIVPGDFSAFYQEFLQEYTTGSIYNDLTLMMLIGGTSGSFQINNNNDTLKKFTFAYPQLSGRFFKVFLNNNNFNENTILQCKVTGGSKSHVTIYRYKSGTLEYVQNAEDLTTIPNIKAWKDNGWLVLILVTNKNAASPYTYSDNFELEIKVKDGVSLPKYINFSFIVDSYLKWDQYDSIHYEPAGWSKLQYQKIEGVLNGNTYNASWNFHDIDNWLYQGNITMEIDFDNDQVNWIRVRDKIDTGTVMDTVAFTVVSIPLISWNSDHIEYKMEGNIVPYITEYFYRRDAYGNSYRLQGYDCGNYCIMWIIFDDDNLW